MYENEDALSELGEYYKYDHNRYPWKWLHNTAYNLTITDTICYDDGCHLKKYPQNRKRSDLTATAKRMASCSIVIDKMHFKGHIDAWCHKFCNPYELPQLKDVSYVFLQTYLSNL